MKTKIDYDLSFFTTSGGVNDVSSDANGFKRKLKKYYVLKVIFRNFRPVKVMNMHFESLKSVDHYLSRNPSVAEDPETRLYVVYNQHPFTKAELSVKGYKVE